MTSVRIDVSSLATLRVSGVANYTELLTRALAAELPNSVYAHYFNFLNRQPQPPLDFSHLHREENHLVPLRLYAKMQSFGIAPPFDLCRPRVDLTILPNFASWPTARSRLRAVVIHDLTYLYYPELVEDANLSHLRRVVPRAINEADIIITVSEAVKAELVHEFSLNPEHCIVTPIPPDPIYLDDHSSVNVHAKYNIPTESYLYFVGTIEPRKNIPTLIAAYRALPDTLRQRYSLIIAGGMGWKTEASRAAIDDAIASGENVRALGYIDREDMGALHAHAALFCTASTYEGFGMPVLEAIAAGTPVVASDIPVLHEVGGTITHYADPHSSENFARAIEFALTSREFIDEFTSGRQELLDRFSWKHNAARIISYVDTTLSLEEEVS